MMILTNDDDDAKSQIIDFENSDYMNEIKIKTNERQQFFNRSKAIFARNDL